MAIKTLFFGDQNFDFSQCHESTLLNKENFDVVLREKNRSNYHTSLEDLSIREIEDIRKILKNAQKIEFCDIENYLDPDKDHDRILHLICGYLTYPEYQHLTDTNKIKEKLLKYWLSKELSDPIIDRPNNKVLWTAGCSFTSAVGVDPHERWGHLVANHFNLEEMNIARGGASMTYASDQIIRSNIQKGDIVVWELTTINRLDIVVDGLAKNVTATMALEEELFHKYFTIDYLDSTTLKLISMKAIHQVIAHCEKIGAELYLINFLDSTWSPIVLGDRKNFLDLFIMPKDLLDLGTDGAHPGPLQHQKYAKEIIKFIEGE